MRGIGGMMGLLLLASLPAAPRDEIAEYLHGISLRNGGRGWSVDDIDAIKAACLDLAGSTPLTLAMVLQCVEVLVKNHPECAVIELVAALEDHELWIGIVQNQLCDHADRDEAAGLCRTCGVTDEQLSDRRE